MFVFKRCCCSMLPEMIHVDHTVAGHEQKLEVLQKWINMDVPAIAMATVQVPWCKNENTQIRIQDTCCLICCFTWARKNMTTCQVVSLRRRVAMIELADEFCYKIPAHRQMTSNEQYIDSFRQVMMFIFKVMIYQKRAPRALCKSVQSWYPSGPWDC